MQSWRFWSRLKASFECAASTSEADSFGTFTPRPPITLTLAQQVNAALWAASPMNFSTVLPVYGLDVALVSKH
jgi:hypothetical protein